jgi:hypothetical protein
MMCYAMLCYVVSAIMLFSSLNRSLNWDNWVVSFLAVFVYINFVGLQCYGYVIFNFARTYS